MVSDNELSGDIPTVGDGRLFQTIVEAIPSAVFIFQGDKMRYVNASALSITDYSKEELLAMPFWAIIHEEFQDMVKQRGRCRQSCDNVPASYEVKIVRKDGESCWVNFHASIIEWDGKLAVLGMAEDITERKQAEAARQESNNRLNLVLDASNDGIWDWNIQTGEVLFSPRWKASLGYSDEEVPNHVSFWKEVVHPDDMPSLQIALQKHFDGETACYEFENRLRMKNGTYRWNLDRGKVVQRDAEGKPLRMVGSDTDITEQVQVSERLKQYEHQRTASIKLGLDALAGMGLDDLFQKTTEAIAETLDVELCKVLELQPDGKALFLRAGVGWKPGLVGHASVGTELDSQAGYTLKSNYPVIVKDLRTETRFSGPPLLRDHGVISGLSVIIGSIDQPWGVLGCHAKVHRDFSENDIHFIQMLANILSLDIERKKFSETLQNSERRLLDAQHIARLGYYVFDVKTDSWTCSKELDNIFGIDGNFKKDLAGWLLVVHPDDKEMMLNYLQDDVLTQYKKFDKEYKIINLKTGHERWVHGLGSLKFDHNKQPVEMFGTIQDITERKQAEVLVRKLSYAISCAGSSIMITDRAGIIEYVNPAFERMSGYSAEDVIGQTPRILNSSNQDAAFYERMWHTITRGNIWHGKVIDKRKDGSFFPAMLTIASIVDDKGLITNFVGSHTDISELEEMEAQFHQAQKMEAVGTLVGGIAHDFNNMLAGMTGNLYLAKKKLQENPDALQNLDNIEKLSFRAADMIKQLLAFARKDIIKIKPLPFTSFIKETLKFLRSSVPEDIEIHQDICTDPLIIKGDATQLHQVLLNLINNARDALEGVKEARISIRLEVFQPDEIFVEHHKYFGVGQYAHLSVEDNGCGVPEQQIEHLFEPFFTTKEQGKGTGLGLAMVFGSVKSHEGYVEVESIKGKGSTFHIYMPLLEKKVAVSESSQEDEVFQGEGELILIADDEQYVRETTSEVLESMGYRVLLAKDGLEAIEVFKAHQDEVDLAILDVVMPHLGGVELAQRIREVQPDLPIIFATGYDKEHVLGSGEQTPNSEMITKPFQFDILSRIIKDQLDP